MSDDLEIEVHALGDDGRPGHTPRAREARDLMVHGRVIAEMDSHVSADTTAEHGGVLVGTVDEASGAITVHGSIRGEGTISRPASLTFTHATWDHVNDVLERDFPSCRMVGWYHSHPHFGIFLSDHDLFIHQNFFSQPWQIAYVVDPLLNQRGFFAWEQGAIVRLDSWDVIDDDGAITSTTQGQNEASEPKGRRTGKPGIGPISMCLAALLVGVLSGFAARNLLSSDASGPAAALSTQPVRAAAWRVSGGDPAATPTPIDLLAHPSLAASDLPVVAVASNGGRTFALHREGGQLCVLEVGTDIECSDVAFAGDFDALAVAPGGTVWIAGPDGLARASEEGEPPQSIDSHAATSVAAVEQGAVVVNADGSRFFGATGSAESSALGGVTWAGASGSSLWTIGSCGLHRTCLARSEELTQRLGIEVPESVSASVVADGVWLSDGGDGRVTFVDSTGATKPLAISSAGVTGVFAVDRRTVWVVREGSIRSYEVCTGAWRNDAPRRVGTACPSVAIP